MLMSGARMGWAAQATRVTAVQPTRSIRTMNFGGTDEEVTERADFPIDKIQKVHSVTPDLDLDVDKTPRSPSTHCLAPLPAHPTTHTSTHVAPTPHLRHAAASAHTSSD